jgi:hypothetical protein
MPNTLPSYFDRATAALLGGLICGFLASATFAHPEGVDTLAYGLPAGNLVERGKLALPQLGGQLSLDCIWLWNAPVMGLGPLPAYLIGGTGRLPMLAGVCVLGLAALAAFVLAIKRALGLDSWSLAVLLAYAFLGHRAVLSEFYNQRYSLAALPLMLAAFWPSAARWRPWWQWLAAGCLPLVHPALFPALAVWCAVVAATLIRDIRRVEARLAGPALFAACLGLAALWYGRPGPLQTQFLAHLRYGNYRTDGSLIGLLTMPASPVASIPSIAGNVAFAALALLVLAGAMSRRWRGVVLPALPAALAIAAALWLDYRRGFRYLFVYVPTLAPILFTSLRSSPPWRAAAIVFLGLLALANIGVSAKVERNRPNLAGTSQATAFLVSHTRPGDRICAGFPFVLAAAQPSLPGGRRIVRLVPMPFMVDGFDEAAYRREIAALCNVYVGAPEWFRRPVAVGTAGAPLFDAAEVEQFRFAGDEVIVVRVKAQPGSPTARR